MYRVIDTFKVGDGLMAVLDPDQVRAPFPQVAKVRVSKANADTRTLDVSEVRVGANGVVALLFPGPAAEVSHGWEVELITDN